MARKRRKYSVRKVRVRRRKAHAARQEKLQRRRREKLAEGWKPHAWKPPPVTCRLGMSTRLRAWMKSKSEELEDGFECKGGVDPEPGHWGQRTRYEPECPLR